MGRGYSPRPQGAAADEVDCVAAALAGYAVRVAEGAVAELTAGTGAVGAGTGAVAQAPASWARRGGWMPRTPPPVRRLTWALAHDPAVASRLAAALAWWWQVRGRLAGQVPLLREAVDRAVAGSDAWCLGHTWLGQASLDSADPAAALRHFTAVCDAAGDRGSFPQLARCLSGRAATLLTMGRIDEAADDARRALVLVREGDHPLAEALALAILSLVACVVGDRVGAVQLARQAEQITARPARPDDPGV